MIKFSQHVIYFLQDSFCINEQWFQICWAGCDCDCFWMFCHSGCFILSVSGSVCSQCFWQFCGYEETNQKFEVPWEQMVDLLAILLFWMSVWRIGCRFAICSHVARNLKKARRLSVFSMFYWIWRSLFKPIQSLMSFTAEREYFLCGFRMEELESQCVLNVFDTFCESDGFSECFRYFEIIVLNVLFCDSGVLHLQDHCWLVSFKVCTLTGFHSAVSSRGAFVRVLDSMCSSVLVAVF